MNNFYVNKAYEYFKKYEYEKALEIFIELGNLLGEKYFKANIVLCQKRIKNKYFFNSTTQTEIFTPKIFQEDPIISIIIPVYNCENFIKQCLNSILNQPIKNIEIICIDDGSTDNSLEIIKELEKQDNRIIVKQQKNQNAGTARNLGISIANGRYIHFVDSDDWVENNIYVDFLKSIDFNFDIYMFSYFNYDNCTKEKTQIKYFSDKNINKVINFSSDKNFFLRGPVVPWNKIYSRTFIKNNNLKFDSLTVANDRYFYFKSMSCNPKILISNLPLYNYRKNNAESLIGVKRIENFNCHFESFDKTKDIFYNTNSYNTILDVFLLDIKYFFEKTYIYNVEKGYKIKQDIKNYISKNIEYFKEIKKFPYRKTSLFFDLIFNNNYIPIVFAVDNNYIKYLSVAILSLLKNASKAYSYHIIIFYTDLTEKNKSLIKSLSTNNCKIEFYNVNYKIKERDLYSRAHYSISMYYRILIPEILQNYKQVIYLDCDILVVDDISKLYFTYIGDCFLGAVTNFLNNDMRRYTVYKLKLDYPNYFNSGILIFNNTKWKEKSLTKLCFDYLETTKDLVCPDQDALNHICRNNIKFIDPTWNFAWQHIVLNSNISKEQLNEFSNYKNKKIAIIHYTSGVKPWKLASWKNKYGKLWWDYAKFSPYYKDFIEDLPSFKNMPYNLSNEA